MHVLILFQLVFSCAHTADQPVTATRRTEQPVTSARTAYYQYHYHHQPVTSTSMTSTSRKNGIAMIIITGLNIFEFWLHSPAHKLISPSAINMIKTGLNRIKHKFVNKSPNTHVLTINL